MGVRGVAAHVGTDLGDDGERRHLADPGDRPKLTDQVGKSSLISSRLRVHACHPGVDFVVDDPDRRAESVPLREDFLSAEIPPYLAQR